MLSVLAAAVLAAAPAATVNAPDAAAERARAVAALPDSDIDIDKGIWAALAANPERTVCVTRVSTGSRRKKPTCGTLRSWFDTRRPGDIAAGRAPWQLVEEIKHQRSKQRQSN